MGYYDTDSSRGQPGGRTDTKQRTSYGSKVKRQDQRRSDKERDRQWKEREKLRKAELEFQKEKFKTQQRRRSEEEREKAQRARKQKQTARGQSQKYIDVQPQPQPQQQELPPGAEPYEAPGAEQPEMPVQAPMPKTSIFPIPEKGKRFVGKNGDWAITSVEVAEDEGSLKAENQETYDIIFMNYRNGKWRYKLKNNKNKVLKISSPDYAKLFQKVVDILDKGGELLERNVNEQKFRHLIRTLIKELINEDDIDEISQTGGIAGYQSPYAFTKGRKQKTNKEKIRKNAEQLGYKLVDEIPNADEVYDPANPVYEQFIQRVHKKVVKAINEGRRGHYHEFRDNGDMNPRQKLGNSLLIVRNKLAEIEKTIDMNLRLKTETGIKSEDYWLRSHRALRKIEEKLVRILHKVKNF